METFCIKNVSCVYLKLIVSIIKTDTGRYFFFITSYFRSSVVSGGAIFLLSWLHKQLTTMGFLQDFKKFAMKGNVLDLAVAVIIGGAFGKIVTALVNDIIMPLVGMVGDGKKFTDKFVILKRAKPDDAYTSLQQAREAGANVLAYGSFIQTIVDFLIIAFSIFVAIRVLESLKRKEEAAPAAPPALSTTDKLLTEIRDELKK